MRLRRETHQLEDSMPSWYEDGMVYVDQDENIVAEEQMFDLEGSEIERIYIGVPVECDTRAMYAAMLAGIEDSNVYESLCEVIDNRSTGEIRSRVKHFIWGCAESISVYHDEFEKLYLQGDLVWSKQN